MRGIGCAFQPGWLLDHSNDAGVLVGGGIDTPGSRLKIALWRLEASTGEREMACNMRRLLAVLAILFVLPPFACQAAGRAAADRAQSLRDGKIPFGDAKILSRQGAALQLRP
jgi:hypothetical protein